MYMCVYIYICINMFLYIYIEYILYIFYIYINTYNCVDYLDMKNNIYKKRLQMFTVFWFSSSYFSAKL